MSTRPADFLAQASAAEPGWSTAYGGPEGIARLAVDLQRQLNEQSEQVAQIRAAAVRELLTTRTLAQVGEMLGITKQAVSKIAHTPPGAELPW